jgi:zeta-carotene desaturase
LDEELDKTDAHFGVDVFWKSFLSNSTGYRMGVPAVPLAQLYNGCKQEIERRGGEVNLRMPLRKVAFANGAMQGVEFDEGCKETSDAYIFAVPHETLEKLLPEEMRRAEPGLANLDKIKVSPITGVHFWFDRTVMAEPFVTLLETKTQWIFNKTQLYGNSNGSLASQEQYLQLVISASYEFLQKSRQEIIDICLAEVRHALPAAREAKLVKATVIKEAAATFSPQPGVDRWRPTQETTVPGMFVAGDWTATGWPATMEGAVRSGYLAAEAILRKAGTPRTFLRPDLPPDGLVALFA